MSVAAVLRLARGHALEIVSVLALCLPLFVFQGAHERNGERPWYAFTWNDSCQAFAAQAVTQRLGAPLECTVWPGATVNLAYLYRAMLTGADAPAHGDAAAVTAAIRDSVFFHWDAALWIAAAAIAAFYCLALWVTRSRALAFFVSILYVTNNAFAQQATAVRPELLSILFLMLAILFAVRRERLDTPLAPFVFGALLAFAVLSKIQILPVLPLAPLAYLAMFRRRPGTGPSAAAGPALLVPAALAALAATLGFLKSPYVSGGYYLTVKVPDAGLTAFCLGAAGVLLLVAAAFSRRPPVRTAAGQTLLMAGGGVAALLLTALPNLRFGGIRAFLGSVNNILFGMASYAVYGEGPSTGMGWGDKLSFAQKVDSFLAFQRTSDIPLPGAANLALIVGAVVVARLALAVWQRRKPAEDAASGLPERQTVLALGLFLAGVGFDCIMTSRTTTARGMSAAYYHVYTLPLYLLAAACALSKPGWRLPVPKRLAALPTAAWFAAGLALLAVLPQRAPVMRGWETPTGPPSDFLFAVKVIGAVCPSFERVTGIGLEALKERMLTDGPSEGRIP